MSLPRYCVVALLCLSAPALISQSPVASPAAPVGTAAAPDASAAAPAAAYLSDPAFRAAIKEANQLTAKQETVFAIDAYRKANKIAAGNCIDCLGSIFELQLGLKDTKGAIKTANELVAKSSRAVDKSAAEGMLARALLHQGGDKPKPQQLEATDQALKAALADYPRNISAHFLEGEVLARMGDMDGARKQFQTCVEFCSPTDPYLTRAKHFAANPALSYAKMAPAFTVTALDGSKFTLDEMGGRVVLIDFWATWCGPCVEELPHMKQLAKDFAGQPLVIISISWDSDENKWKQFIQKNEMTWPQYRDADHKLAERFGINAIPHYFTIDSDGVLTAEMIGTGYDVERRLKKLIAQTKEKQAPAETASATPGS